MKRHGIFAFISILLTACGGRVAPISETPLPPPNLDAVRAEFARGVVEVTDGVHVAIGYGLANSILLEGENGLVIVDTLESRPRAEQALAAFREITGKPIKAIILTHNHADHVFGGSVFQEDNLDVPVYAHESLDAHVDQILSVVRDTIFVRSMRMFGQMLPKNAATSAGIGMDLDFRMEDIAIARPTQTFSDRLSLEVEGIRMELIHAPGETPDQIVVWLPDKRVLLAADNFYKAFPNLYTIRGTAYRDVMDWVRSLDLMRDLGAEYLVPSHTRPVVGRDAIEEALTAYRDAIQFVHDQTIRGLNKSMTPDDLAATIHLPPHLATNPYLQPVYGDVAYSVRSICDGYMGWFGGDATDLNSLAPGEESRRMMDAFAAGRPLPQQAQAAYDAGDFQWAAQLARHWTRQEPENADAKALLANAFQKLGEASGNFNTRNYYLSQAMEWRGELTIKPNDPAAAPDTLIDTLPIDRFMRAMTVRLKAEECLNTDRVALFHFSDINQDYTLHIRRGVAEVRAKTHPNPDMEITCTTGTWRHIATQKRSPAIAYATGDLELSGGVTNIVSFLGNFER